ncbi:basic secretory family protein [Mucilaginibacter sp. UR6-1]|uniref:basic secretory family protein n=1 Tax=Mucilaginibacter sp. UR6-1 TaxID=1435643 RepID=UPI001E3D4A33|nr:basic secretory family protein [Mucilaginibacter sp. UR6-1]MCC8410666.1 basic secretory family protein [Mucilaginibacter sp. UR6-1]
MIKRITSLILFVSLYAITVAQTTAPASNGQNPQRRRNQPRAFSITVIDAAKTKVDTGKLGAAFRNAYPPFAAADGYRTKREVTMRIIDTAKGFTIKAVPGEIVANGKWLKSKKNLDNFQQLLNDALHKNWASVDTIKKDGYSLVFINKNSNFDATIQKNLIETYFEVYPKLVGMFNNKATHDVVFVTDTAYKGVAEASGNRILFATRYMNKFPFDVDVVTHEGMHIVQGYGYSYGRDLVWLTEGIADFIRYKYGVDNVGSKWYLPSFKAKAQGYKDSYRVTARFFEWIDQKIKPGMIVQIDKQLRDGTFKESTWADLSGKSLDELWAAYSADPVLHLVYSSKNL